MKLYLLAFFTLCSISAAIAQPTLTAANTNPTGGESYKFKERTQLYIGSETLTGANYTWDFSTLDTINIFNHTGTIATTSNSNKFKVNLNSSGASVKQYDLGAYSDKIEVDYTLTQISPSITYTNHHMIRYPFTMGSTYTQNWVGTSGFSPPFVSTGKTTVTADGYGTLKLPTGTYNDVLRVKIYEERYDTSTTSFVVYGYQLDTIYRWYLPNVHWPVLETQSTVDKNVGISQPYFWKNTRFMENIPTSIKKMILSNQAVKVYPNPATDNFVLKIDNTIMQDLTYELYTISGTIIPISYKNAKDAAKINLKSVSSGVHFLSILKNGVTIGTKQLLLQ